MNVPWTRRSRGVSVSCSVTWNAGARPRTLPSARLWSPSWANASLRIASSRELRLRSRGDGEVPGLVQVAAGDPGAAQGGEDPA